jgi:hypothetical protein
MITLDFRYFKLKINGKKNDYEVEWIGLYFINVFLFSYILIIHQGSSTRGPLCHNMRHAITF